MDLALLSPHAGAAMSKKDCERGLSCTAARVLKFSIWGRTKHEKVFLKLLRPRTDVALSGMRGLSCTELCAVAPKKSYYVMWLSAFVLLSCASAVASQCNVAVCLKADSHIT